MEYRSTARLLKNQKQYKEYHMPRVIYLNLPYKVYGVSVFDADGFQTIVLNAKNSFEQYLESYKHEWKHKDDFGRDINVEQLGAKRYTD